MEDNEPKFVSAFVDGIDCTPEGNLVSYGVYRSDDVSVEEAKTAVGEMFGTDPSTLMTDRELAQRSKTGRKAVAFSSRRWNSSWDPDAERAAREAEQARREKADLN